MSTTKVVTPPTVEEFLAAPPAQLAEVAPATVLLGANSAPLTAAYAGIAPNTQDYARLAHEQLLACIALLFRCGIRNVVPFVMNANLGDDQRYRGHFLSWVEWGTTGPEALAAYEHAGCRARLIGTESLPELGPAAERLRAATDSAGPRTLWWTVTANTDALWAAISAAAQRSQATTHAGMIRALYGEDIPPAGMFLGFGKPYLAPGFVSPLLIGETQCYWSQRPGFGLDEPMLRRVIYDYAYARASRGSATDLGPLRAAWETGAVLGVGQRLGDFWYPAPFLTSGLPAGAE